MIKAALLTTLFVCAFFLTRAQLNVTAPYSGNAVPKVRPADYEFSTKPDSLGNVNPAKKPSQNKSGIKLPYPVIFLHGGGMSGDDWNIVTDSMDAYYNTSFGGRFDFCLNYDANDANANNSFWPTANADIAFFSGTWCVGDYYYINFNVGDDGSYNPINWGHDVKSKLSGAVKQGTALREVIYRVLQLTGRDKVILMAHSFAGLEARQYLQNPSLWQPDGKHHVAKLITAGSPHGGSNTSLSEFLNWIVGADDRSEGMRDLRLTYSQSGDSGVFLYGGLESYTVMDDLLLSDYYNVDVNCNGYAGDNIIGLNHKNIPRDLDYAVIIAECNGCPAATPGDGMVLSNSANLNNIYPNLTNNVFYYYANNLIQIHGDLSHLMFLCMEGMDEPNDYQYSYNIEFNKFYTSFITQQPLGGYNYDYDDFKFTLTSPGAVTISISDIDISDLKVRFVNSAGTTIGSVAHSNGNSSLVYTYNLNPGDYYLEIFGLPTTKSYLKPYTFVMTKTITTGNEVYSGNNKISIYPNPATDILNIEGITSRTSIKMFDLIGNLVKETETEENQILDISQLPQGVYTLVAENNDGKIINKIIVSK